MPKLRKRPREAEIYEELYARWGGMMTLEDIKTELGAGGRQTATRFIAGMPCVNVNALRRWRVSDVARRIYDREVTP